MEPSSLSRNRLLENGADVNVKDKKGQTALMLAAGKEHLDVVKLLLNKGADVNVRSADCRTLLMMADEAGHVQTVKLLLEKGADVNAKDCYCHTVLESGSGHPEIAELLKAHGAR